MIVNHRDKWLYFGPPRTGSTTLHITLCYPEFGGEPLGLQHDVCGLAGYRILASARNPFSRARSLYRYLTQNLRGHPLTWFDYCRELADDHWRRPNRPDSAFWHWTIDEWLRDVVVDRFLHLETLDSDLRAEFPQWHGLTDVVNTSIVNPRVTSWSLESRRLVEKWGKPDLARCGYPIRKGSEN